MSKILIMLFVLFSGLGCAKDTGNTASSTLVLQTKALDEGHLRLLVTIKSRLKQDDLERLGSSRAAEIEKLLMSSKGVRAGDRVAVGRARRGLVRLLNPEGRIVSAEIEIIPVTRRAPNQELLEKVKQLPGAQGYN